MKNKTLFLINHTEEYKDTYKNYKTYVLASSMMSALKTFNESFLNNFNIENISVVRSGYLEAE